MSERTLFQRWMLFRFHYLRVIGAIFGGLSAFITVVGTVSVIATGDAINVIPFLLLGLAFTGVGLALYFAGNRGLKWYRGRIGE
jgi:hypothetical protein